MELFKKSFTLYVESGMREMTERRIILVGILEKKEKRRLGITKDLYERFYKVIVDHYLRKFLCFYLHRTRLITTIFAY